MIILEITTGTKTIIMIAAMIIVFYLFLIRPQSQKAKAEEKYRQGLKNGDRVITANGIHATVVSVNGVQAQVEVAPGVRINVQLNTLNPVPEKK